MVRRLLVASNFKTLLSVLVPALLIASLSVYVLGFRPKPGEEARVLLGKPLAAYEQFYPIRANEAGSLYLDKDVFEKAIDYFATNPSPQAIADLIYLGNSNHVTLTLGEGAKAKYVRLSNLPDYAAVAEADA